jgi:hypothetical protein
VLWWFSGCSDSNFDVVIFHRWKAEGSKNNFVTEAAHGIKEGPSITEVAWLSH